MRRIKDLRPVVRNILITDERTRDSDTLLFYKVCQTINPVVSGLSFETVLLNYNDLGLPRYESVSRNRRLLQERNPSLRGTEQVTDGRYESYKEVKKYVSEV